MEALPYYNETNQVGATGLQNATMMMLEKNRKSIGK